MVNKKLKQSHKTFILWMVIIVILFSTYNFLNPQKKDSEELKYFQFHEDVIQGKISKVVIKGRRINGAYRDGTKFNTFAIEPDSDFKNFLISKDVQVEFQDEDVTPFWKQFVLSWLPALLLFFFFIMFMRQLQAGGGKALSFGKSRAKLLSESHTKVTFEVVAGVDEAKEELEEIISFLKEPKKFTKLGGRIPKGVLLMGPPGTGKTLLARAIAGEAGVPFFSISGSDFVEMFVGVGASRVRDLFEQGTKQAPCIIFIDEIDAVGRHRGAGLGGGHDEREQTLNQLLVEMDGFESKEGVILISATNRPDVLDPALLRPGRFDRRVIIPLPDVKGREGILKVHTKKTPLDENVNLETIARGTPGFSGADLENLVNEASLLAARLGKDKVFMADIEKAKDKVIMGYERKSMIISDDQKKITAFHEAGHALVAKLIPGTDPIHKVTIIPRGMALGLTQQLPQEDRYIMEKKSAENDIAILMGGRSAEEIIFNMQTTGAGNDIEKATTLARKMVCEWGMSDNLGPLTYGRKEEAIFLGKEFNKRQDYSESTAIEIDEEVKKIVLENYKKAKSMLLANKDVLTTLAQTLLEKEVLDGNEIELLVRDKIVKMD